MRPVDHLQRRYADRASRTVNQLDERGEHAIEDDHTSTALQAPAMEQQLREKISADIFCTNAADTGTRYLYPE